MNYIQSSLNQTIDISPKVEEIKSSPIIEQEIYSTQDLKDKIKFLMNDYDAFLRFLQKEKLDLLEDIYNSKVYFKLTPSKFVYIVQIAGIDAFDVLVEKFGFNPDNLQGYHLAQILYYTKDEAFRTFKKHDVDINKLTSTSILFLFENFGEGVFKTLYDNEYNFKSNMKSLEIAKIIETNLSFVNVFVRLGVNFEAMNSNDLTKIILKHGTEALEAFSANDVKLISLTSSNMKDVILKHGSSMLPLLSKSGCAFSELEDKDLEEIYNSENGKMLIEALKDYGAVFFSDEDFQQIDDSSECLAGVCEVADSIEG